MILQHRIKLLALTLIFILAHSQVVATSHAKNTNATRTRLINFVKKCVATKKRKAALAATFLLGGAGICVLAWWVACKKESPQAKNHSQDKDAQEIDAETMRVEKAFQPQQKESPQDNPQDTRLQDPLFVAQNKLKQLSQTEGKTQEEIQKTLAGLIELQEQLRNPELKLNRPKKKDIDDALSKNFLALDDLKLQPDDLAATSDEEVAAKSKTILADFTALQQKYLEAQRPKEFAKIFQQFLSYNRKEMDNLPEYQRVHTLNLKLQVLLQLPESLQTFCADPSKMASLLWGLCRTAESLDAINQALAVGILQNIHCPEWIDKKQVISFLENRQSNVATKICKEPLLQALTAVQKKFAE